MDKTGHFQVFQDRATRMRLRPAAVATTRLREQRPLAGCLGGKHGVAPGKVSARWVQIVFSVSISIGCVADPARVLTIGRQGRRHDHDAHRRYRPAHAMATRSARSGRSRTVRVGPSADRCQILVLALGSRFQGVGVGRCSRWNDEPMWTAIVPAPAVCFGEPCFPLPENSQQCDSIFSERPSGRGLGDRGDGDWAGMRPGAIPLRGRSGGDDRGASRRAVRMGIQAISSPISS